MYIPVVLARPSSRNIRRAWDPKDRTAGICTVHTYIQYYVYICSTCRYHDFSNDDEASAAGLVSM